MPVPLLFHKDPQLTLAEIANDPGKPFMVHDNGTFKRISKQSDTNLQRVAGYFSGQLQQSPRLSPKEAKTTDLVKVVRGLLRSSQTPVASQQITQLKTELLAFQLGIPSKAFAANEGFKEFAEGKPPLAPYLAHYDHKLQINDLGEIEILRNTTYQTWSTAQKELQQFLNQERPKTSEPWVYGPNGIQTKDMFQWDDLQPLDVTRIESNEQLKDPEYFVEICACTGERPKFGGDHSFARLISNKTCNGERLQTRYSVGLYSPYGKTAEQKKHPLALQDGYLQSPDVSEFWPFPISTLRRAITQEQFEKLKTTFEMHKRDEKQGSPQPIQLIGQNCTSYVVNLVREAGIALPDVTENGLHLIGRSEQGATVGTIGRIIKKYSPAFVSGNLESIVAIGINMLFVARLGAASQNPEMKDGNYRPHYQTRADIWNPQKLITDHPWGVRREAENEQLQPANNLPQ